MSSAARRRGDGSRSTVGRLAQHDDSDVSGDKYTSDAGAFTAAAAVAQAAADDIYDAQAHVRDDDDNATRNHHDYDDNGRAYDNHNNNNNGEADYDHESSDNDNGWHDTINYYNHERSDHHYNG